MSIARKWMSFLVAAVALCGCSTAPHSSGANGGSIVDSSYLGADRIALQIGGNSAEVGPVLVTSLANVSTLDTSSAFGRISADEIGSRLSQRGFLVLEARMRNALLMRPGGEFMLSDEVRSVAQQQKAASVLVGTYADSGSQAIVSLKLIRVADSAVIASSDYVVSIADDSHDALLANAGTTVKTFRVY